MRNTLDTFLMKARKAYYISSYNFFKNNALPPLQIIFEPTYRCNHRCKMCPFLETLLKNQDMETKTKNELTPEEIMSVVKATPRYTLISLTGGEPFVRDDIMEVISGITRKRKLSIVSNGTLITKDMACELVNLRSKHVLDKGVFLIFFSLLGDLTVHDSITQSDGSFIKLTETIKQIVEFKKARNCRYPLLAINCVITKWNYPVLSKIFSIAEELEVDYCNLSIRTFSFYPERHNIKTDLNDYKNNIFIPHPVSDKVYFNENILKQQLSIIFDAAPSSRVKLHFLPHGLLPDDIIDYYCHEKKDKMEDYTCYSPWWRILITAYGDATSCPHFFLGNIKKCSLADLWNSRSQKNFRLSLRKGTPAFCNKCGLTEKFK